MSTSYDQSTGSRPRPPVPEFSDTSSLVPHTKFGNGPIRHIDSQGLCFHGVNNHSESDRKLVPTFSKRSDLTTDDFLHCHVVSPSYEPGSRSGNPHYQWDHNDPRGFCTHCIQDTNLSKYRPTKKVYKCLGHKK